MESILYDSKNSQTYKFGLHILDYVPKDMALSIIDIGSGSGALTKELTFHGGNVIGIDKNIKVIEHAKQKYPTVPFYVMDACRLQYENRFDIAFSNATFHEIADKKRLFASIFKCLKNGGKLIAEFPSKNGNKEYFDNFYEKAKKYGLSLDTCLIKLIDKDECIDLLEEAGFRIEHLEENIRRTYVKGNDENVRDLIAKTVSKDIDSEIREKFIDELLFDSENKFKSKRGWVKDVCRIRVIAVKD